MCIALSPALWEKYQAAIKANRTQTDRLIGAANKAIWNASEMDEVIEIERRLEKQLDSILAPRPDYFKPDGGELVETPTREKELVEV